MVLALILLFVSLALLAQPPRDPAVGTCAHLRRAQLSAPPACLAEESIVFFMGTIQCCLLVSAAGPRNILKLQSLSSFVSFPLLMRESASVGPPVSDAATPKLKS